MIIPEARHDYVRNIDINHITVWSHDVWANHFRQNEYITNQLGVVLASLGDGFTRSDLVGFYQRADVGIDTKFIAAMIWGHGAPEGGRRDGRGPWKLEQMFGNPAIAQGALNAANINNDEDITAAYNLLNENLPRCGPNFFTKHFYFLGKALGQQRYPLIFDDRVANGLISLIAKNHGLMGIVKISTNRTPAAYISYLNLVYAEKNIIDCHPDQIEYFLFTLR